MKKCLVSILLFVSVNVFSQPISKSWIDNQAKIANAAFDPAYASYYINNANCDAADIGWNLRYWSSFSIGHINVVEPNRGAGSFSGETVPCWVVLISGCPDPTLKKITAAGTNKPYRKKLKNE